MNSDSKPNNTFTYNGEIVAGSLLINESRKIARLLLNNVDSEAWHQAIVIQNIFRKCSPVAAKRQVRLIKNRLSLMKPDLWEIVDNGSVDVAIQALLCSKNAKKGFIFLWLPEVT
jgi:hypothetical protein